MRKQVRVTVSIDQEHLEAYKRMAAVAGLSVSRCLGEWLGDTVDSALFVSASMVKAKKAPQTVLNEMLAMTAEVRRDILEAKDETRHKAGIGVDGAGVPRFALKPPFSNTGVKVPKKGPKRG